MRETSAKKEPRKQTEIGEIPENWRIVELGDYSELITKGSSPKWQGFDYCDKGIPFVRSQNVGLGQLELEEVTHLPKEFNKKEGKSILKKNDLLINIVGSIGRAALANDIVEGGNVNQAVAIARLKQGVEPFFVMAFLFTLAGQLQLHKQKKEIARANLSLQDIKNLLIPLPPLPEQRAIAHVLQTIQEAKAARQRELALERERKAALMDHLFSYGTRGEPRKQTEIGEIPESWEVVKFAKTVEIAGGQIDPRQEPYRSMIHVGPENIESGTGRLVATNTNADLNIRSGNYYFAAGEILYSKIRPYLNKAALPEFEGTCSADVYPLRPYKEHFERKFLFQFLLSKQFNTQAISHQNRTGIPKINRVQLGSVFLLKPLLSEQAEIAEILQACDTKIAALEQEAERLDELFHAMLDELMTGKRSAVPLIDAELPN